MQGFPFRLMVVLGFAVLFGCATPAPTATLSQPPAAIPTPTQPGPTPTKAPTATPTKRPVVKAVLAAASRNFVQTSWVVAEGKGYYREEGLDLEIVITGSGAKALAAVVGQSAHLTTAAAPEVLAAVSQQQPVQAVGLAFQGEDQTLILRPEIAQSIGVTPQSPLQDRLRALKGLKLAGSSPGSANDVATRFLLRAVNLDPERDVEISYIGLPAILPAIQTGAVDGFVGSTPDSSKAVAERLGVALVVLSKDFPETRDDALVAISTHKNVIKAQPEIPEAAVRALWRGIRLLKENKADAKETFRKTAFPDMDQAVFNEAFEGIYALHIPDSPAITTKAFESALNYRNKTSTEPSLQVKYEDYYNPKFVEAAKKQLGF